MPVAAEDLPMGSLSIWHWLVLIVVALLLFGRGKISDLMGDVAQGIKAFKKGMAEDDTKPDEAKNEPVRTIDHQASAGAAPKTESEHSAESVRS
jgi:sec-independent protein translocase protein TatA